MLENPHTVPTSIVWELYLGLEQITVNPYTFSRLLPRQKRSHDSTMGVQSCGYVCCSYTDFARRAVRFSRSGKISQLSLAVVYAGKTA